MGGGSSKEESGEAPATEVERIEIHELLHESQGLTKSLVRDVIDLMSSLDMLKSTTRILKDNLTTSSDKTDHGQTEETSYLEMCKGAALQLLLATEKIQQCQKQETVNTLKKLLKFIKSLVEREVECKPGSFGEELLQGYMEGRETTKTIEERRIDAPDTQMSDYKNKKKKDMLKDITDLKTENNELRQKVIRFERKEKSFYLEKKLYYETNQKLESQLKIKNVENKLKEMSHDFDNNYVPKDRIEQLSCKLTEAEKEKTFLNEKIDSLKEENGRLTSQLIYVDLDKARLEIELEEKTKLESEIKKTIEIETENAKRHDEELRIKLTKENDELKQKIEETESRTTDSLEEYERLKEDKLRLEKAIDKEAQKNKKLETELIQKSEEHKVLCFQKDERIKELNRMETKLSEIIKEKGDENLELIKNLQQANENLGRMMVEAEKEEKKIKLDRNDEQKRDEEQRIKLTEEIDELREKNERLKEDKRRLEKEKNEEAQRNKSLESELAQKSEEHKVFSFQKDERIKELNRMESKLSEIIKERGVEKTDLIKNLQQANDNLSRVMDESEKEKEKLKLERNDEKRRDEEQRIKLTKEIDELRQKIQDSETRTTSSIEECEQLKEDKRRLENEKDKEAQRNKSLETELKLNSEKHKVLCFHKDEKIEELNRTETKLNDIINEKGKENVKLIKTLQKANENFGSLMISHEKETEKIELDGKKREEELRIKLTEAIDEITRKFQDTETKTTALLEECDRLRGHKRKLETERDEVIQRNKNLENELAQKADNYKVLNEQKDGKIKELVNTKTKFHKIMTERELENGQLSKTLQNANDNFNKLIKKFDSEKEMLIEERNEEKSQKEELKTQLANNIDQLKQQLQQKEKKINDLTVVQNEMKSKESECQTVLKQKDQKINELVDLNDTMQKQQLQNKKDYEHKILSLENENQLIQMQLNKLRGDLKAKSDSEKKLLEESRVVRADLQKTNEQIERMNTQHENTKLQLTSKITAISEAQLIEKNTMEDRERTLKSELQTLSAETNALNDLICKEQHARKEKENLIAGMGEQLTNIEKEKTKLETRLTKIAQDLKNCTAENETIKNELEKIKSRKVIQIQMYSQSGVGLLSSVEDELKCVLKSQMDVEESVDVDIIICAKASDIQPNIPLLILCIQASRLGTAVASTVQGLTLTPKMAVLIFHHKDVHALPNQASERVLTGQELRSLGGIFDLAFLSGKGIYPCEMNRINFISLVNFIKREGKKRLREEL